MTSAVEKMKERSRQWAAQLAVSAFAPKKTLWVSARGEIVIDVSMVYLQGEAFVLLQVKHAVDNVLQQKYTTWTKEYIKVPRPHNKKERGELLRNMATMHAMQLGYPHKLRSKV